MANPFEPASRPQVESRFSQERGALLRTLEVVNDLLANLDGHSLDGTTRLQFFVLFQLVKAFKTAQSIERLVFDGYDEDAQVLLRVLVEQAIVVRWVQHSDSDERARAYALVLGDKQYERLRLAREFVPNVDLGRVPVHEIEAAHAAYLQLPNKEKWRSLTRDIEKLAAESGMRSSYLFHVYGTDYVHSNPTIEGSYTRTTETGTWFNSAASMPRNGLTPVIAAQHLLFVADVFNDQFGLGADAALQELMHEASQPSASP